VRRAVLGGISVATNYGYGLSALNRRYKRASPVDVVAVRRSTNATLPRSDLPDLSGLTILVVDDNDDSLHMLGEFLRACHAHVVEARGALSALSFVETQPKIDAVVTDLSMPQMDGLELVQRLRSHPRGRSVPAIHGVL
jgi:PleD family two-component response regulator